MEARQRAEGAEVILRSARAAFDATKLCLKDDLNRALAAQDEAKAREQAVIDHSKGVEDFQN